MPPALNALLSQPVQGTPISRLRPDNCCKIAFALVCRAVVPLGDSGIPQRLPTPNFVAIIRLTHIAEPFHVRCPTHCCTVVDFTFWYASLIRAVCRVA